MLEQIPIRGEVYTDEKMRTLYATDASAYKEMPLAVTFPQDKDDLRQLITFAAEGELNLIPRTAGTSLAGQVVGSGIIVDVSRTFCEVLEINKQEAWVRVEPAVVRNELNQILDKDDLLFGPITSTANRAMLGGMLGNNSCGQNSLRYGSVRDRLISVRGFLSDGSEVTFGELDQASFEAKCQLKNKEGEIYRGINTLLSCEEKRNLIVQEFPKAVIKRRNTGYALDILAQQFEQKKYNLAHLIAGSEGTLFFATEMKLALDPLAPPFRKLICAHFESIDEALRANIIASDYKPMAAELMDYYILECTAANRMYRDMRFFVEGEPQAILIIELDDDNEAHLEEKIMALRQQWQDQNLGYSYPIVEQADIAKVWALRSAGLGLLSNVPGDAKAVPVIEDTCVSIVDLPQYIEEFNEILDKHKLYCVHYAHAGSGELHLRPIIDLKTEEGHKQFRLIAEEIAHLVKKYEGSLSGEHGDGRLRGEFIQVMVGEEVYSYMKAIKGLFDPKNIFNPGKITDAPPMDQNLRFAAKTQTPQFETAFDFSHEQGYLRAAEFCNGSGDCRKSSLIGGTMCPSYMATKREDQTTRARANILREYLRTEQAFESPEIKEIMDTCLSCKGCKSECPSNVDMAKLKSEYLYQRSKNGKLPLRDKMIARSAQFLPYLSMFPRLLNYLNSLPFSKKILGLAPERDLPQLAPKNFGSWFRKHTQPQIGKSVYLFVDEFSHYYDVDIAKKAVLLLNRLGYNVLWPDHGESGRAAFSKGDLDYAKTCAERNVEVFANLVSEDKVLIGIEPSALLCFRDEYTEILRNEQKLKAEKLAKNTFLFDEFIAANRGDIDNSCFTQEAKRVDVHAHCFQKALAKPSHLAEALSIVPHYSVKLIDSGCCGMAGSFGYETEHYSMSMDIAQLKLVPHIEGMDESVILSASGTSCRHQMKDASKRQAMHPIEVLYEALVD